MPITKIGLADKILFVVALLFMLFAVVDIITHSAF